MTDGERRADYSLLSEATNDAEHTAAPKIQQVVRLEVEEPEIRCLKGDCNGDYPPGG